LEVAAPEFLAELGYLLVPGAPFDHGAAYLLVAIRPRPTREHFDPERIEYWSMAGVRAVPAELSWPMATMGQRYGWGTISFVDRVAATNRFVSFGGRVTVSRDGDVHAALFRSDAPILSLGGHSDPADPLAANIGGFFATLRAAAGDDPAIQGLSDSLEPNALYAAFLARSLLQYQVPAAADGISPRILSVLRAERCRVEAESGVNALAGAELAAQLAAR
jgi:hypothetical protein